MPDSAAQPMGYGLLRDRHGIACLPHDVESFMLSQGTRRTEIAPDGRQTEYYVRQYWPGDSDFDHLEFALRYEGLHLGAPPRPVAPARPRRLREQQADWCLRPPHLVCGTPHYEIFTGTRLDLPAATQGNCVDLSEGENSCRSVTRANMHRDV